mmetsp:Transcript_39366/g.124168  ORF Transcript_39366/g.124168 Transcript_39366/m.124168 type:complete len:204 (+) Transcript_39366:1022-1633(+)
MSRPCATWSRFGLAPPSLRPQLPTGPSSRWRTRSSSTSSTSCCSSTRAAARPPRRRCATRTSPRTATRPRSRSTCPSSRWTLRGAAQARRSCARSSGKRCCACGSQSDSRRAEQRARRQPAARPPPARTTSAEPGMAASTRGLDVSPSRLRCCAVRHRRSGRCTQSSAHAPPPWRHTQTAGWRGMLFWGRLEPSGGRAATISA